MTNNLECFTLSFSQSEDDIRPEDELGDLINKSLLPGPNLEITTGSNQLFDSTPARIRNISFEFYSNFEIYFVWSTKKVFRF